MAVINKFTSWQTIGLDWKAAPYNRCSKFLAGILLPHLLDQWGGASLGCHADREVRSGGSVSSHAYGAALDWRWYDPGPGRSVLTEQVLPFLINNSAELGIQAIHDYVGSRIWRPPGHSGRPAGGDGWKQQSPGGNMGASWAQWIHIEVHPDHFDDVRPIGDRLQPERPDDTVVPHQLRNSDTRLLGGPITGTHRFALNVPNNAKAVALNIVGISDGPGHIAVWPDGQPDPGTSVVNFIPGQAAAGACVVGVNERHVTVRVKGTAHVIVDITAYWT